MNVEERDNLQKPSTILRKGWVLAIFESKSDIPADVLIKKRDFDMERCKTLINKLQEQVENGADVAAIMITTQLLQLELARLMKSEPEEKPTTHVSVVLPGLRNIPILPTTGVLVATEAPVAEVATQEVPVVAEITTQEAPAAQSIVPHKEEAEVTKEEILILEPEIVKIDEETAEAIPEDLIFPVAPVSAEKEVWILDPVLETPTLAHQDEIKELNEMMGKLSTESLNDRLKTVRSDISSTLTDAPVRDLKKAIGVNDRFLYLSELFRGDVDMYERSIKTINNFRILAEAEYWIERELRIKLGWDVTSAAVAQFNQLVKRRFASI